MANDTQLSVAIDLYLEAKRAERLSKNTLIDYTRTFTRFQLHFDHDPLIAEITVRDIRQFMNDLDGLSDKSVLNCHIGLSSLWTWAIAENICEEHIPCGSVILDMGYEDWVKASRKGWQAGRIRPGFVFGHRSGG